MNEETVALEETVESIGEIASDLLHPWAFAFLCDAGNVNLACSEADDEKNVIADDSSEREDLNREEVRGGENIPMTFEEVGPGRSWAAFRCRSIP